MSELYIMRRELHKLEENIVKAEEVVARLKKQHKALSRKFFEASAKRAIFDNMTEGEIDDANNSRI